MIQTEETLPFVGFVLASIGRGTLDPEGVVLETDGKTFAG
jgi:hypothetical protein